MSELSLQDVPPEAHPSIIEALGKASKAVYRTDDGSYLVFQLLPDPNMLLYSSVAPPP
jgi:hypothetical protein